MRRYDPENLVVTEKSGKEKREGRSKTGVSGQLEHVLER